MIRKYVVGLVLVLIAFSLGASVVQTAPAALQDDLPFKVYFPLVAHNAFEPVIAFATNRTGNFEIYVLHPGSQGMRNVTRHPGQDMAPAIGPRGLLAWASNRDGNWEIYVGDIYGRNVRRLTVHPGTDFGPTWTPDGQRVAFSSDRDSPSGSPSIDMDIFAMNVNRTGLIQLTNAPGQQRQPAWSPDGSNIAFSSDEGGRSSIWTMEADGAPKTRLTDLLSAELFPTWSPDSQWVLFSTDRDGTHELQAVHVERLTSQPATRRDNLNDPDFFKAQPSWSPDGKFVVFRMKRDNNTDLYMMNFDATGLGTGLRRLTTHPGIDTQPAWSR